MTPDADFVVDLRSDTVTRPTAGMRAAMASAEVGDDVNDGDPTVQRLQSEVANALGKEAALFFPSGTMANLTAVLLHTRPGTEVVVDANSHVVHWDMAGCAAIAGVTYRLVTPTNAVMNADDVHRSMRPVDHYGIRASLLFLENTHNSAGDKVTALGDLRALSDVGRNANLPVHLDGARLWNASIASGTSLAEFSACADTVMVAFSKALGAPVGAALAGSAHDMHLADDIRKRLGGGMRQSGIIAAGALYGMQHHYDGLRNDHIAARTFADAVDGVGGARVVAPDTNIVMIDLPSDIADDIVLAADAVGVRVTAWTSSRIRAVTHLDAPLDLVVEAGRRMAVVLDHAAK
ncbi:MAG: GntG family PLP-dependent aldolase [Gemmatimonadaceae bacterium]